MMFKNKIEETEWLEETVRNFGQEIIKIRQNNIFKMLLQNSSSEAQWNSMMNGKKGYSYPDFYENCGVRIEAITNLNELVVKESKDTMMGKLLLYTDRKCSLKYKNAPIQELKSDEEEEEDESDIEIVGNNKKDEEEDNDGDDDDDKDKKK